jgi:hypothetical protein
VKCVLFNLSVWWMLLGLLDEICGLDGERDRWTFSGAFYDVHHRTCPEVQR